MLHICIDDAPSCKRGFELFSSHLVPRSKFAEADNCVVSLAVFAQHEGRQTPYVELLGQIGSLLGVDLDKACAPMLLCEMPQMLVHDFASPRALSPEMHHHSVT